jgi:hypothetical protein
LYRRLAHGTRTGSSYKRTPIAGICVCHSEKQDKRIWHAHMRAAERAWLYAAAQAQEEMPATPTPTPNDVSTTWDFGKDGKHWYGGAWLARQDRRMRRSILAK